MRRTQWTKVKWLFSLILTAGVLAYALLLLRRGQYNILTNSDPAPMALSFPGSAQGEIPLKTQQPIEPLHTGWKKYVLETGDCSIPNIPPWSKALQETWQEFEAPICTTRQGIVSYIEDQVNYFIFCLPQLAISTKSTRLL